MNDIVDDVIAGAGIHSRPVPPKGYRIEPFLSAAEIQALAALHRETKLAGSTDHHNSVRGTDAENKRRIFEGIKAIVEQKIPAVAPGYRMYMASFVTKRAGGNQGRLPMHADPSTVNYDRHIGLNIWCPLCDVDERNGCMKVVEASPRLAHISAVPPLNPSPFDHLRSELESSFMTSVPMSAGSAMVFDTRLLHATEPNVTAADRVSLFLNLVPEDTAPRFYFWNPENRGQLEIYDVDTEFVLTLEGGGYPDESQRQRGTFVGLMDYAPAPLTIADLDAMLVRTAPAAAQPPRTVAIDMPPLPVGDSSRPPAPAGVWGHFRSSWSKVFASRS